MKLDHLRTRLEKLYARLDRRLGGRLSLLVRVVLAYTRHDGPLMARSLSYYALFAVFPAILALIVVASAVLESDDVQTSVIELVTRVMPMASDLVAANIEQLLQMRQTVGLLALLGLLWSASGVFSATFQAVNRAWGVPQSGLALSSRLYGLMMMSIVGVFLLLALALDPLMNLARAGEGPLSGWQSFARPATDRLVGWLSALVPALVSVCAFASVYRFLPRARVSWREAWRGGLVAGLIWDAGRELFTFYVANFANYSMIYGSVGAIIVFLLGCYLSAQILLLGAEFTAEDSRWREAGRPMEIRPLGEWMASWSPAVGIAASGQKDDGAKGVGA